MKVWNYPLELTDAIQSVEIPADARVVDVADRAGQPTLWALVDPAAPRLNRYFTVIPTGEDAPPTGYVGTAHCGALVWHVFEVRQ